MATNELRRHYQSRLDALISEARNSGIKITGNVVGNVISETEYQALWPSFDAYFDYWERSEGPADLTRIIRRCHDIRPDQNRFGYASENEAVMALAVVIQARCREELYDSLSQIKDLPVAPLRVCIACTWSEEDMSTIVEIDQLPSTLLQLVVRNENVGSALRFRILNVAEVERFNFKQCLVDMPDLVRR